MQRTMLKSKIHRATVTDANLHYVGSVTVDEDLMRAADLLPGEQVAIVDVTNGARLETYVITGPAGSGVIGINGAAAHLVQPGDLVILISYGQMDDAEARSFAPRVVFVDERNRVLDRSADPTRVPESAPTSSLLRPGTEARTAESLSSGPAAQTAVGPRPVGARADRARADRAPADRARAAAAGPAMASVGSWEPARGSSPEPRGPWPSEARSSSDTRSSSDGRSGDPRSAETTDAQRLDALLAD